MAQGVYGATQGAGHSSDSRVKALYAMQALANAPSALANSGSASQAAQNTGVSPHHIGIGGGRSHSGASTHDDVAYGSQISSAGNVTVAAMKDELNVSGSQVHGKNVTLAASHNRNLTARIRAA